MIWFPEIKAYFKFFQETFYQNINEKKKSFPLFPQYSQRTVN